MDHDQGNLHVVPNSHTQIPPFVPERDIQARAETKTQTLQDARKLQKNRQPQHPRKQHHHYHRQQQKDPRNFQQRQHFQNNDDNGNNLISDAPSYHHNFHLWQQQHQSHPQQSHNIRTITHHSHLRQDPQNQHQNQRHFHRYNNNGNTTNNCDDSSSISTCSSGDGSQHDKRMYRNRKSKYPNYNRNRRRDGQPFHKSSNFNDNDNEHFQNNNPQFEKEPIVLNKNNSRGNNDQNGNLRLSPNYNPKYNLALNDTKNKNSKENDRHNHYFSVTGGQSRQYTSHRQQYRNSNRNHRRYNHHPLDFDRKVSSVALNGYLRECGWSLPDYDENEGVAFNKDADCDFDQCEGEGESIRKRALALLEGTLSQWVDSVAANKEKTTVSSTDNSNNDNTRNSSGKMLEEHQPKVTLIAFGSYRLGAYQNTADIDLLALCPTTCTRHDFFSSLVALMEDEPSICDIHPIASAFTPVLKFTINSINFDMLFGRVHGKSSTSVASAGNIANSNYNRNGYPYDFPIDDSFLFGMDDYEIRSANGVRVTQYIMNYVPYPDRFRLVLCAVKEWATLHGIYSNILGFLGGVNWAMMVALVCKRYPKYSPTSLLRTFFQTFATWPWPRPVILGNSPQQNHALLPAESKIIGGMKPWDPRTNPRDARHVMPIITPVSPRMNSAYNVGISQQRRIQEELTRAAFLTQNEFNWRSLYIRSDFFDRHANFLQITIRAGSNRDDFTKWLRLCESRLRILVNALDSPDMSVWPFAQIMKRCYTPVIDDDSVAKNEVHKNDHQLPEALFFIGLRFGRNVDSVNLKQHTSEFLINQINGWDGRKSGMDFVIQHILKKDLPFNVISEHLKNRRSVDELHLSKGPNRHDCITGTSISVYGVGSPNSRPLSTDSPSRPQSSDEVDVGSRPDSRVEKFVRLEGVPPPKIDSKEEGTNTCDDISNKINQEQLFNFLTGKTEDLPPCVGSHDECTQSTESEDLSSTMSPIHKRPRNRPRSGTEDSELLSDDTI